MTAPYVPDGAPGFNPNRRFALLTLLITLIITYGLLLLYPLWDPVFAWLIAINVVTFFTFGYDKAMASAETTRVPEAILLIMTALGGSIGAVIARPLFRHKTRKVSFRLVFWPCVILSVGLTLIYYGMICPECR
jgi:uncharacterized membrane protein YsdA (DUF1294 family)